MFGLEKFRKKIIHIVDALEDRIDTISKKNTKNIEKLNEFESIIHGSIIYRSLKPDGGTYVSHRSGGLVSDIERLKLRIDKLENIVAEVVDYVYRDQNEK